MISLCVTIQMEATEQYFPVVLFIILFIVYCFVCHKLYKAKKNLII